MLIVDPTDQELVQAVERPKSRIVHVIEGFETVMFRSKFESWPQTTVVTVSKDGRGKVAGQQLNYLIDFILDLVFIPEAMMIIISFKYHLFLSPFSNVHGSSFQ